MTTFQIAAIALFVCSVAWAYIPKLPALHLPTRKPNVMRQLEAVIRIRDEAASPEVKTACNALLQQLLR